MRVLSLESRRSSEMAQLILNQGGQPVVAPSTREVPAGPNDDALRFAADLVADRLHVVIFTTGVGTRALAQAIEPVCPRELLVRALSRTRVVARGPKPGAVLREFGVPIALTAPEPSTWHELVRALDDSREQLPLDGRRVAVQEYGVPNQNLYAALRERGADVFPVKVYHWAPPEDTKPLGEAVLALGRSEIDVVLVTSSIQLHHLLEFAHSMKVEEEVVRGLNRAVVASIGPTTSEALESRGIAVDLESTHPRMGFLVKEAAEQSAELLRSKRR